LSHGFLRIFFKSNINMVYCRRAESCGLGSRPAVARQKRGRRGNVGICCILPPHLYKKKEEKEQCVHSQSMPVHAEVVCMYSCRPFFFGVRVGRSITFFCLDRIPLFSFWTEPCTALLRLHRLRCREMDVGRNGSHVYQLIPLGRQQENHHVTFAEDDF